MKLIIGGAYQGKLTYAKKTYDCPEGWIDGRTCDLEAIETCRGINHFHDYVKRMLWEKQEEITAAGKAYCFDSEHLADLEQQAQCFADRVLERNPGILVVSNELGYGVVPMEKKDRLWRETVGRICTCLADRADEVVRVVCGIGVKIK